MENNEWFKDNSTSDRCKNCGVKYEYGEKMCFCPEGKLYKFQSKVLDMIEEGSYCKNRKNHKYF